MNPAGVRESAGLSQAKFAQEIGSNQSSINRYENGQAAPPIELLRKYADHVGVSMDYIFSRCDAPPGGCMRVKILCRKTALNCMISSRCALNRALL